MAFKWNLFLFALIFVVFFFSFRNKSEKSFTNEDKLVKTFENRYLLQNSSSLKFSNLANEIQILLIFSKAENNSHLQNSFDVMLNSLLKFAGDDLRFHIVGDEFGRDRVGNMLKSFSKHKHYRYETYDIDNLTKEIMEKLNSNFLSYFRHSVGAYYGNELFFLSLIMHEFQSFKHLKRVIKVDCDLKFMANINDLWKHFEYFNEQQLIGLVNEQSPVYRHVFGAFRNQNKGTICC